MAAQHPLAEGGTVQVPATIDLLSTLCSRQQQPGQPQPAQHQYTRHKGWKRRKNISWAVSCTSWCMNVLSTLCAIIVWFARLCFFASKLWNVNNIFSMQVKLCCIALLCWARAGKQGIWEWSTWVLFQCILAPALIFYRPIVLWCIISVVMLSKLHPPFFIGYEVNLSGAQYKSLLISNLLYFAIFAGLFLK